MQQRLDLQAHLPTVAPKLFALNQAIEDTSISRTLLHLIKMRASQINGCAYCLNMHSEEAIKDGDSHQRLHVLAGWRESGLFTPAERAVLAWTEAVTTISETDPSDALYADLQAHFSTQEIAEITMIINMINLWNRVAVAARMVHPSEAKAA
jgi:AhpD family alkylhydroperoxidase